MVIMTAAGLLSVLGQTMIAALWELLDRKYRACGWREARLVVRVSEQLMCILHRSERFVRYILIWHRKAIAGTEPDNNISTNSAGTLKNSIRGGRKN